MFWPLFAFTPIPLPAWGNISSDQLGYDGVGRMITKRYLTGGINGTTYAYNNTTALVADTTSFDRAGNKLYERHLEAESRSHLYQPFNSDGSFGVGYDSANRLLQVQRGVLSSATIPYRVNPGASITTPITLPGTDQVKTYGLDGLGNWKTSNSTLVGSGGSTTSTAEVRQHNYVNEITSVKDTTGGTPTTTPFAYDHGNNTDGIKGNGNLVNDGVREYQYDGFNRLIQVSNASGTVLATYQYDAFDRRVQKTIVDLGGGFGGLTGDIPAGVTDYFYDGQQIVEQRNDAAPTVWTQVNFWGQYVDEMLFFAVPTATTYRVLSDLLYRSVAIVTTANVVTEAYDCDAYGNTLCYSGPGTDGLWFTDDDVRTNNPVNSTIFTGRQYDPESQIYYYRARYLSPQIGRFLSRDPLGSPLMMADATEPSRSAELSQGPNLYWYVQSNPINAVDPLGLWSTASAAKLAKATGVMQDECKCCVDQADVDSCKKEAAAIGAALVSWWNASWGSSNRSANYWNPGAQTVGGFFCWDWADAFSKAIDSVPRNFWSYKLQEWTCQKSQGIHFAVQLYVTKPQPGASPCELTVDDGFTDPNNEMVHPGPVQMPGWTPTPQPSFSHAGGPMRL